MGAPTHTGGVPSGCAMKKKRVVWSLAIAALLLAVTTTALLVISDSWIAISGWLRDEPLCMGKPTSYWSQKVKRGELTCGGWFQRVGLKSDPPIWLRGPAWTHRALQRLGINTTGNFQLTLFDRADPKNIGSQGRLVPLFRELLKDQDPEVRRVAAFALGSYSCGEEEDVRALKQALEDENQAVRRFADIALGEIRRTEEYRNRGAPRE